VLGQTYQLLRSAAGYRERGVASWYGPDFHAKNTANGEAYDMYAMTAAHRTLPIPVYLKVTNLANGKSVTVRVNDRGPFKHNRIVDLSYTAAMKLDMLRKGTALVEVEAILPPGDDGLLPEMTPEMLARAPRAPSVPKLAALATGASLYAQVGAFGVEGNAFALRDRLTDGGVKNVLVVRVKRDGQSLWRVRIGPIGSVEDYDGVVDQLERLGIREISLARLAIPAARAEAQAAE
jgi:rare lipoprotein A